MRNEPKVAPTPPTSWIVPPPASSQPPRVQEAGGSLHLAESGGTAADFWGFLGFFVFFGGGGEQPCLVSEGSFFPIYLFFCIFLRLLCTPGVQPMGVDGGVVGAGGGFGAVGSPCGFHLFGVHGVSGTGTARKEEKGKQAPAGSRQMWGRVWITPCKVKVQSGGLWGHGERRSEP